MKIDTEQLVAILQRTNKNLEKQVSDQTDIIKSLNKQIDQLNTTVANLEETIRELNRKIFGVSSEQTSKKLSNEQGTAESPEKETIKVSSHERKPRSSRKELYKDLPIEDVYIDIPEEERFCDDCGSPLNHLGYKYVREELRITPAKVERIHYYQQTMQCPVCKEEDDDTFKAAKTPTPLLRHSSASPSVVATIIYEKYMMYLPFYRQNIDWSLKGVPMSRSVMAGWCIQCTQKYFQPVYEHLHRKLRKKKYLHADEVPCQVLKEEGREAAKKSYMWLYLTSRCEEEQIILYEYQPGRKGEYPQEFLSGFSGYLHCDGYSAYHKLENVTLVCCLAHARRKFFEAIPSEKRKAHKLLDIDSEKNILADEDISVLKRQERLPAEVCFAYCNKIFYLERIYKEMDPETRKDKRLKNEKPVWDELWKYLDNIDAVNGSKLKTAVTYAINHKEQLMNYLKDGRCACSNNRAERKVKSYVQGRKNFLFHDSVDGANSSAVLYSIIETAKANNLNVYQYLYTLLLYMPDLNTSSAGIEALMPWSDFIKERCAGIMGHEKELPEKKGKLPLEE